MNELMRELNEKVNYLDEAELRMVNSYMGFLIDQKSKRMLAESLASLADMEGEDAEIVNMEEFRRKKLG